MKVGILTFHRAINYGAVLQCYALKSYLNQIGYDAEVIDYRPGFIDKYRLCLDFKSLKEISGFYNRIRSLLLSLLYSVDVLKANKNFDVFIKEHLNISKKRYYEGDDCRNHYDVIFVGSDQIWNRTITKSFDSFYFGSALECKRLVSYAASMGRIENYTSSDKHTMSLLLRKFYAISVREKKTQEFIEEFLKQKVSYVLDPTLLINQNLYDRIAVKPQESNYILVYSLYEMANTMCFAKKIREQLDCNIVVLKSKACILDKKKDYKIVSAVSPSEFLGYIKYSKCVIAVSFHGIVFSTIFRKDFYSLKYPNDNRVVDYLSNLGLLDRHIDAESSVSFSSINYSDVITPIDQMRTVSTNFIKGCLNDE